MLWRELRYSCIYCFCLNENLPLDLGSIVLTWNQSFFDYPFDANLKYTVCTYKQDLRIMWCEANIYQSPVYMWSEGELRLLLWNLAIMNFWEKQKVRYGEYPLQRYGWFSPGCPLQGLLLGRSKLFMKKAGFVLRRDPRLRDSTAAWFLLIFGVATVGRTKVRDWSKDYQQSHPSRSPLPGCS